MLPEDDLLRPTKVKGLNAWHDRGKQDFGMTTSDGCQARGVRLDFGSLYRTCQQKVKRLLIRLLPVWDNTVRLYWVACLPVCSRNSPSACSRLLLVICSGSISSWKSSSISAHNSIEAECLMSWAWIAASATAAGDKALQNRQHLAKVQEP